MKLTNYFVPQQEGALLSWSINYDDKIGLVGPGIGLTAEMITGQKAAAQAIIEVLKRVQQKKNEFAEAKAAKRLLRSKEIKLITDVVTGYKKFPGFTENAGRELGIMSTAMVIDEKMVKATVKAKLHRGYVGIYFNKQNMTGVTVFSRLKGSEGWDELATVKTSPYVDKRPLQQAGIAETREYMVRCYNGFDDVGLDSDIVSMLFGG
jgi:hypothetical protein